jgi:hypothetical protein
MYKNRTYPGRVHRLEVVSRQGGLSPNTELGRDWPQGPGLLADPAVGVLVRMACRISNLIKAEASVSPRTPPYIRTR